MGIGSGIVADSEEENEWNESLLKGEFLTAPIPDFQIIETMFWSPDDGYWLLDYHLDRLVASAEALGFFCDREAVMSNLNDFTEEFHDDESGRRVRLLLYKNGEITLADSVCEVPNYKLLPELDDGVMLPKVKMADRETNSHDRFLYHKTTRRQVYDDAFKEARQEGYFDILFCNEKGLLTEGAISNIFLRYEDRFVTPPVENGLLPGVFRRYFLEKCPFPVEEREITVEELPAALAVYVGNSVRGLVRVRL
jgi:para-aminobenzoate synthetase/4-amino-4-deoxychorismate lyase